MDSIFLAVLNMSFVGAFVIAAICLARIPLKKAPKIISYWLWAVAGFRLLFPFSIESVFSLMPFKSSPIPPDIAMQAIPRIDSGITVVDNIVSGVLPAAIPYHSANPLQIWTAIGSYVWLLGIAVMVIYGVVSYIILKRKMRDAACTEANIYEADNIKSPFVLGIIKPKIYLPFGLGEKERNYILLHEQTHIKRHDHVIKFGAYFILCLHWFNPLAWAAFLLMSVDMEMSCDERVMKEIGGETKKEYSLSLLSLATERRFVGGSPLAFGEGGVKQRIKNVLKFQKPTRVIIIASVTLALVLSVGFSMNRINSVQADNDELIQMEVIYVENPASFFSDMRLIWNNTVYYDFTPYAPKPPVRGTEIGFAWDNYGQWRIFECEMYGQDFLIMYESENMDVWRLMHTRLPELYGTYIHEHTSEEQMFTRMRSVILYKDGTARLTVPPIVIRHDKININDT